MARNEPQPQQNAVVLFRQELGQMTAEFGKTLPPNITPDYFSRVMANAVQRTPRLLLCDRASLWNAAMQAAEDGLLPDKREGAIVPFKKGKDDDDGSVGRAGDYIATWIPMVRGIRKLIRQSGEISDLNVQLVFVDENEAGAFAFELGDPANRYIRHRPMPPANDRHEGRPVYAGYSIAVFKDQTVSREVMFEAEIMAVGRRSKGFKHGPWSDALFALEMRKKTVTKRHFKQLPTDRTIERALSRDDALFDFEDRKRADDRRPVEIGRGAAAALQHFAGGQMDPVRMREPVMADNVSRETEQEQTDEAPKATETPKEEGSGKTAPKAATKAATNAGPAGEPKTAKEYQAHALAWFAAEGATADGLKARWSREKALRNACNVEPELREALEAKLDAVIGGL